MSHALQIYAGMRKSIVTSIAISLFFSCATPRAEAFCFNEAAERYSVAPELLMAISAEESGMNENAAPNWNKDGSYDVGIMRINSNWYHWSKTVRDLWPELEDPCTNVMVGAWILSKCISKYGYNWKAVGCYHSQTPEKRDNYAKRIAKKVFALEANPALTRQIAGYGSGGNSNVAAAP